MASIARDPNRRKRILFVAQDGSRKTIRLGKMNMEQARLFKTGVESLLACMYSRSVMDATTAKWVGDLSDKIHSRFVKAGLVEERAEQQEQEKYTVSQWVGQYITSRADVKSSTVRRWRDAENKMAEFFPRKMLTGVTAQDAMSYRVWLKTDKNLAENTVRKLIGIARQFWNAAITAKLVTENPFIGRGQPVTVRANKKRLFYVTREIAYKVLEACPDATWRLLFGLVRWGGLRCPSEVLGLKWQDVDFEHERFVVRASKTEHHADGGIRTVPMFPELQELFQDAFDMAKAGDVYCIARYSKAADLRGMFYSIVHRAGVEPWPKPFQNCRSTRETELFRQTNGNIKAVCSWIGNSPAVALEHYHQLLEADMQEAARAEVMADAEAETEKAAQKAAQHTTANGGKPQQNTKGEEQESAFSGSKLAFCGVRQVRENVQPRHMGLAADCDDLIEFGIRCCPSTAVLRKNERHTILVRRCMWGKVNRKNVSENLFTAFIGVNGVPFEPLEVP